MKLILAVSGATGAVAAALLVDKSPWPVSLVVSEWGRNVYERECGPMETLEARTAETYADTDLGALPASGSVASAGMVILPCSTNTLAKVAAGIADTLITRAAHCHLKEKRKLVLCVRESPWTAIDFDNARRVTEAGGTVMPISPPYYMLGRRDPSEVTLSETMSLFVDRVLSVLGCEPEKTWENCS